MIKQTNKKMNKSTSQCAASSYSAWFSLQAPCPPVKGNSQRGSHTCTLLSSTLGGWNVILPALFCFLFLFLFVVVVPVMNYLRDLRPFRGSSVVLWSFSIFFFLMDSNFMQIEPHLSLNDAEEPQKGTKGLMGQSMFRQQYGWHLTSSGPWIS